MFHSESIPLSSGRARNVPTFVFSLVRCLIKGSHHFICISAPNVSTMKTFKLLCVDSGTLQFCRIEVASAECPTLYPYRVQLDRLLRMPFLLDRQSIRVLSDDCPNRVQSGSRSSTNTNASGRRQPLVFLENRINRLELTYPAPCTLVAKSYPTPSLMDANFKSKR